MFFFYLLFCVWKQWTSHNSFRLLFVVLVLNFTPSFGTTMLAFFAPNE
ncbi:hypothetical protein Patl1_29971 [Pistacia atlantica]|uniref:Uncharacterized protein n=1 Tax=Pistacia atlantica TaxID=434234 RepID=A0ACC1A8W8_9ROSI|nr:hypothetical protein Patl1_29971 [Pistacia atlantica]